MVTVAARQATDVWFMQPVRVGDTILQGRYVIEHDNDRMARGEPCTHIYAFNNQKTPIVAFHCMHLQRRVPVQRRNRRTRLPDGAVRAGARDPGFRIRTPDPGSR